jgi:hypothetical protein
MSALYIQFAAGPDGGEHIRKWSREPFDGAEVFRTGSQEMLPNYYVVWNDKGCGEGFITEDYSDAAQTASGHFLNPCTAIGREFFEAYGGDAPLPLQAVWIEGAGGRPTVVRSLVQDPQA